MKRVEMTLTEGWRFALGPEMPGDEAFAPVRVPHDWTVGRQVSREAALEGAQGWFLRGEVGWYRRTVHVKSLRPGRRHYLDFGGVWECASVWVNDTPVGVQRYGYSPFRLDVTEALRPGENAILVRVDNTGEPADRWYSGCGIYRPVRWLEMDEIHLDARRIRMRARIAAEKAEISIETGLDAFVCASLYDPSGAEVACARRRGTLTLCVPSPRLWSAQSPELYRLVLSLDGGDAQTLRLGLRTVEIDAARGLRVNGAPVKLHGVCLHQDLGPMGIAWSKPLWRDRLGKLKAMGVNALRLAHHMHHDEMLDLCDEMGFYVYEECFDKWRSGLYGRYFERDWKRDLETMILRDRNRPSVIFWGVGNEVENQGQPSMVETLGMLADRARALDDSRPVTYAMNPHFKRAGRKIDFSAVRDIQKLVDEADEREIEDMDERLDCIAAIAAHVDVLACNYQEQWFEEIHRRLPDKAVVSTEAYPFFVGHPDSMQNYTQRLPMLLCEDVPYALGGFVWAGFDYLGESMGWPSKGWTGSLLRMDGAPRIAAHILKSRWTDAPMVHVSILDNALGDEFTKAHWASPPYEDVWDFPGLHQGVVPYLIATNCERVELHSAGRVFHPPLPVECPQGYITGFVPWMPGKLEALGFVGGVCVCRHALVTPGEPAVLALEPMVPRALGEGEEMLLIVRILDGEGHPCVRETRRLAFFVEGDAELLAVDNADLMETTPYSSREWPAWHGRASAVVRRTGAGAARLIVRADGLRDGICEL